jgi:hypothetical protein
MILEINLITNLLYSHDNGFPIMKAILLVFWVLQFIIKSFPFYKQEVIVSISSYYFISFIHISCTIHKILTTTYIVPWAKVGNIFGGSFDLDLY